MSVTLVKSPQDWDTLVHPISNCLEVCLKSDSYLITAATAAQFVAEIDAVVIPLGSVFTFFGQTFTTGIANTYNTFIWNATDGSQTAINIIEAFSKNALISGMYTYTNVGGTNTVLTVTWKETGLNSDFTFDGDVSNWLVRSSGTDAVYQEGYQFNYELWQTNPNGDLFPILPSQSCEPILKTDGTSADTCIEFQYDIRQLLQTTFFWRNQTIQFDKTAWGRYLVRYGDQKTKTQGCGVDFMGVAYTPSFEVINAVCQSYEVQPLPYFFNGKAYKMAEYDHRLTTPAKFLTSRPRDKNNKIYVCKDEYINLWFYIPSSNLGNFYEVVITYFNSFESQIGTPSTYTNINPQGERIMVIPASVNNFISPPSTAASYSVQVFFDNLPVSEILTFVSSCDCCTEQVFFVCDKLGYDTMKFSRVESRSINVNQSEICLDVPCGGTISNDLQSGIKNVNTEAYETFTLISEKMSFNDANLDWFIQFKKSESRYILRKTSDENDEAFGLILSSGDVQIYQYQDSIQLSVTGQYGFSLDTQPQG
jgi:hypothetical protein